MPGRASSVKMVGMAENWFAHAYASEKFPNFYAGVFQPPKQLKIGNLGGVCNRGTAKTAQF